MSQVATPKVSYLPKALPGGLDHDSGRERSRHREQTLHHRPECCSKHYFARQVVGLCQRPVIESLYVVGISLQAAASNGPAYVILNNLEIMGAAAGANYTADDGSAQQYVAGVAGVRIVNGNHIKIQNCYIHGITGNGIFGKPNGSFPGTMADIELLYNHIAGNGQPGSFLYHNSYLESDQSLYIGNLYEPLVTGGLGSDLKDRPLAPLFPTIDSMVRLRGSLT